jgi:prepilin-type N-terminal cleavage/methylation domain-containing protein/prepilin-type processing-associated H-X9-DG protein
MSPDVRCYDKSKRVVVSGFTLVELLVVIGIIAVLIAIVLPAFAKAREQSKRASCLANLRSIGQAMILYANDHRDRLPNSNPANNWGANNTGAVDYVMCVFANKYVRQPATFHCPSDDDPVPQEITTSDYDLPDSARTSYDFYSIWWAPEYGPRWCKIKQAPLAWDIRGGWATPMPYQNHGTKGGNVVFGDGHADWQEQQRWDQPNFPNPGGRYFPDPSKSHS